jgi:Protein of unknown function (DUF3551)
MRCGIVMSAALMAGTAMAFTALSATGAQAQQWCGFNPHPGAMVQCGYSSQQGCENAIGKGAMCYINPYLVMNESLQRPEGTAKRTG